MPTPKIIYQDHNKCTVSAAPNTPTSSKVGHRYHITMPNCDPVTIQFQMGGIQHVGHNGIQNEHLLAIITHRLINLNEKFPCEENTLAIDHITQALNTLESRTQARIKRGVEGQEVA